MSVSPIIQFKAGYCDLDDSSDPPTVKPRPTPGYVYLWSEDELVHFAWRPRSAPLEEPELDLMMVPADGTFQPHHPTHAGKTSNPQKPTNGRIYVFKFSSSSEKHLFWLQSKSQHPSQDPAWFSARDLKLGEIVNDLLQGEEVNVSQAMANLPPDNDGDEDETMEDIEGTGRPDDHHRSGSGGAGPDATGGDIREEGEGAREGGADGGRASSDAMDANTIIQNFINSMSGGAQNQQQRPGALAPTQEKLFTTLADLLTPQSTIPSIEDASGDTLDQLLQFLPPTLTAMVQEADDNTNLNTETSVQAAREALSLGQKKEILRKVLRSPQFSQSLASLTVALRDGGLPIISESLGVPVRNGGYMRRGGVPLGGGEAVEAFLDGVKDAVEKEGKNPDSMDTQ